jgi:DNA-binding phage protein
VTRLLHRQQSAGITVAILDVTAGAIMRPSWYDRKDYDTRVDRFRVRENINIGEWADGAGMARTQLNKYRAGYGEPRADTLARIVDAARRILGRPVKASELFDVGEDVPVPLRPHATAFRGNERIRRTYGSRIDDLLRRLELPPAAFARMVALSQRSLQKLRTERGVPSLRTIRQIVRKLRSHGYEVTASDVVDVGED